MPRWPWALIALLVSSPASASPQDLFGVGGRTPGMAMTGTSYAEGYEAVFSNVAGLAAARRRGLFLGVQAGAYALHIDGVRSDVQPARGLEIGFHLPLPFGDFLQDRLVIGGSFFTPAAVLLRGRIVYPDVPSWAVLDRGQSLAIQVGLGIDLHGIVDGLQIGVGISALANVIGSLDVRLDETNSFTSTVETQLLTSFAPLLGVRYSQPQWGVGLAYRHEVLSRMSLDIVVRDLPMMLMVPRLTVGGLVQYDPPTLLAEGYYRPLPDVMVVVGLTTRFWSAWPGAAVATSASSNLAPAPDFSIVPSPRAAIEGRFHDDRFELAIRGGYAFEPTPAPPARMALQRNADGTPGRDMVPFRILDSDRHVFTAGVGIAMNTGQGSPRLSLDAYLQLHVLDPRQHLIGATDGAQPMITDGFVLAGGWMFGAEF